MIAANEFLKYWHRITKEALAITNTPEKGALQVKIGIPAPDMTFDPKFDSYRIKSLREDSCDCLHLVGGNGRSTLYAVYDFFERRAGCRWFWDGDVVPECKSVNIADLDIYEVSKFEYRGLRYFAHRGLTRFQAEHWGLDDWKREIDWCLKSRLNLMMLRIGMDDIWQKAFPDIVPYPDASKPLPEQGNGYDNRSLFWPLESRGRLRKAITDYACDRGMILPSDFGTMTHWYSRTPQEFLNARNPPFLPQANSNYNERTGLVWDVRKEEWMDCYWHLTEASINAGYGKPDLLHTIGLGERICFNERDKNLALKNAVIDKLVEGAKKRYPNSKVLLAGWDFWCTWHDDEVRDLVRRLDPERTLIFDYEADAATEETANGNFTKWGVMQSFPYTFGIFLCLEQAIDIRANYQVIEERQSLIEDDPFCKGYILWPESSHTDIMLLRYFTANAWRGGRRIGDVLPEFCRDRYGAQAAAFEPLWRTATKAGPLLSWWGTYANDTTVHMLNTQIANKAQGKPGWEDEWELVANNAQRLFKGLSKITWNGEFVRRDTIDIARTLTDRLCQLSRAKFARAFSSWRDEKTSPDEVKAAAETYLGFIDLMPEVLALHTDYSLAESYDRLDAIEKIANPDFGRVLIDNATNFYCMSHQYETAECWIKPFAHRSVKAILDRINAGDRSEPDAEALKADSSSLRDAMLATPLAKMRPRSPQTPMRFRQIMQKLAKASEIFDINPPANQSLASQINEMQHPRRSGAEA